MESRDGWINKKKKIIKQENGGNNVCTYVQMFVSSNGFKKRKDLHQMMMQLHFSIS